MICRICGLPDVDHEECIKWETRQKAEQDRYRLLLSSVNPMVSKREPNRTLRTDRRHYGKAITE